MKKNIVFIIFLALVLIFNFFRLNNSKNEILVFDVLVTGEVNNPSSVSYSSPTTLGQIIKDVGGLTKLADTKNLDFRTVYDKTSHIEIKRKIRVTLIIKDVKSIILELSDGAIIKDALDNLKEFDVNKLDTSNLNLTKTLVDGDLIEVKLLAKKEEEQKVKDIYVELAGAIRNPGVYKVKQGTILNEVIIKAGGFTESSDTDEVNLVQILDKNIKISIPNLLEEHYLDNRININLASIAELAKLPRLGETKALAIVERRKTRLYESIDELREILGDGLFEQIKEYLRV